MNGTTIKNSRWEIKCRGDDVSIQQQKVQRSVDQMALLIICAFAWITVGHFGGFGSSSMPLTSVRKTAAGGNGDGGSKMF